MSNKGKFILLTVISLGALLVCACVGSVYIPPGDIAAIARNRITGAPLPGGVPHSYVNLLMDMRFPRVVLAYITGAALSLSGGVMQSALQNPLASPFSVGVSAGAGMGAAVAVTLGVASLAFMPLISLAFALGAVFAVVIISAKVDRGFSNAAIVLIGMAVSLFCAAVMNMLAYASPDKAQRIQLWQLGSLSMREWDAVAALAPALAAAFIFFMRFSREMDIMTFGDEQARAMGVDSGKVKKLLLGVSSALTGLTVSYVGIIGFVDLIVPYAARRLFGASHNVSLPGAALTGGIFLTLCDLAARTLARPREIPLGAITALLGAPFFIYIFYRSRKDKSA